MNENGGIYILIHENYFYYWAVKKHIDLISEWQRNKKLRRIERREIF